MSKFIDAVQATLHRQYVPQRVLPIHVNTEISHLVQANREAYTLEVGFCQSGFCRPQDIEYLEKNFIRALRKEIYGDVEDMIIKLERCLYEQDLDNALSTMRDLKQEIFG